MGDSIESLPAESTFTSLRVLYRNSVMMGRRWVVQTEGPETVA
jgi:hypothetical protein